MTSTSTEKFEVGFHTCSFASLPLEKALRYISDAGFAEVEIEADKTHMDPRLCARSRLADVRKLLGELSIHPSSVHAPFSDVDVSTQDPEARNRTINLLVDTIEYCRAIECQIIVIHPNHSDSLPIGREAMKKNSIESLTRLTKRAEDLGVRVALENMTDKGRGRFGSRVSDLREIIDDIGSPHLGICFDTGHSNLFPNRSLSHEEEIIQAGEYLWTLHIHDNDGVEDRHWPPGDGNIDWAQVIGSLRRVNYRGVFMMEIKEAANPDELAKRCLQRATEMLARYDPG